MPSARASTSPSADSTSLNPAARAAWAVAAPTANTRIARSAQTSAKARTPLALVKASAATPGEVDLHVLQRADRQQRGDHGLVAKRAHPLGGRVGRRLGAGDPDLFGGGGPWVPLAQRALTFCKPYM